LFTRVYGRVAYHKTHETAQQMLADLRPSSRQGVDFRLNEPLAKMFPINSRAMAIANSTQHSFYTSFEHVDHQLLKPESILATEYSVTGFDKELGAFGGHRCSAALTYGMRFPTLENIRRKKGWKKGDKKGDKRWAKNAPACAYSKPRFR